MLIYRAGLRIQEATNLRIEDVDSRNMRLFVRNGKVTFKYKDRKDNNNEKR